MVIVVFGFMFLLLIVIGVKLHNRNRELDELYDEYEIDLEDDVTKPEKPAKSRYEEQEDDGISLEDFEYEEEEEETFQEPVHTVDVAPSFKKTMKEESTFEDFDLDFIDLDD